MSIKKINYKAEGTKKMNAEKLWYAWYEDEISHTGFIICHDDDISN